MDTDIELGRQFLSGPTMFHHSFIGGAPLMVPPIHHDIVVIDNFWPNPMELRRKALTGKFTPRTSSSGFVFSECVASKHHCARVADLISRVAGPSLLDKRFEGRFVAETKSDEVATRKKVWVHYDRWYKVAVLYLSLPSDASGGTGFYRHIKTGHSKIDNAEKNQNKAIIANDSTKMEKWELLQKVEIKFNRLVLFSPCFFHQALSYFGETLWNSRLYSIVVFSNEKHR